MSIRVRAVEAADFPQWSALYAGYRGFYRLDEDDEKVRRTWEWVSEQQLGMHGLVAVDDAGALVGLANLRWFARPSTATIGLYLDDLFTAPGARGTGAGTALLRDAAAIAADAGASVVRWITASDNATARSLYDQVATATPWVTYDMAPATR